MCKKPIFLVLSQLPRFRHFLVGMLVSFGFSGCFIADEFLLPPEKPTEKTQTLQQKSEASVKHYLIINKGSDRYDPYGFGELKIIKPIEIKELERLEAEYKATKIEQTAKDIDSLKTYISKNRLERRVEIEHFFTLKDSLNPTHIDVLESKFILNDTLGVIGVNPQLAIELEPEREDVLVYYFFEYTIFLAETYQSSKELSKKFYDFFKSQLEELKGIREKSDFLEHVLNLCAYVKQNGEFEPETILRQNVASYILEKRKDITAYRPFIFSTLFAKQSDEKENNSDPQGYYFFHKFIGSYENETDTNVVMVEFSKYYEIEKIYQMERPYDRYFKK
jgi:hypothetical protein